MVYFDAAYIAKFYLTEPESDRVRAFAARERQVCCSLLGRVETAQVFHRKLREGRASKAECAALFDQFEADCAAGLWSWLPLTDDLADVAARCFRDIAPKLALRSADSIHLVSARAHGLKAIYSNDARVLAAAPTFGLRGLEV